LREAFTNLVFNAVDALAEGGTIGLRARRVGSRIVAEVSDTGSGIPPELQARIFEPFFTTKGEQGTGLGLAQVAGVVARHGGELLLESGPGRGTTFRMLFPVTKAVAQNVVPEEPISRPAHRPRRVLAVEDDPKLRNMIDLMLRPHGHDVRLAESAEAALQVLEIEPPFDVVISDVSMGPGMTGWELAERIRERWPGLPVVLASGWGAQIDPDQAAARGIAAVLAKPYRMSELRDLVAGLQLPGPSAHGC
jgi:CheY-like chemotaxis protein